MPRFHIEIDVECETLEEADEYAKRCLRPLPGFKHITLLDEEPLVTANPEGQHPNGQSDDFLQVFLAHAQMIAAFQQWVTTHGWVLQEMPRFDVPAHHYTPTHQILPANLDALMAERAAQYRKDHPND